MSCRVRRAKRAVSSDLSFAQVRHTVISQALKTAAHVPEPVLRAMKAVLKSGQKIGVHVSIYLQALLMVRGAYLSSPRWTPSFFLIWGPAACFARAGRSCF